MFGAGRSKERMLQALQTLDERFRMPRQGLMAQVADANLQVDDHGMVEEIGRAHV